MFDFFIKIIKSWAKFFGTDESTLITLITSILLITGILIKYFPKWLKYFRNKQLAKDLHPFFTFYEIRRSTRYFIKTRFQNIAPSREVEYSKNIGKIATEPLIPFLLKTKFKIGKNPDRFYLILSDSGMGKTTFIINLFIRYKKQWKKDYNIKLLPMGHPRFDEKLAEIDVSTHGETILLLDAFDEDIEATKNYKKRFKEILEKTQEFRKVIITSRTQFFPGENALNIETNISRGLGGNYFVRCLYISPFSKKEIKYYLSKKFSIFQQKKRKRAFEIANKVPYLMVRPMLLSKIEELLEEKKNYEYARDIYQTMTDKWIDREANKYIEATKLYKEQLLQFTQAIALDIYGKRKERNALLLNPKEIQAIANQNEIILDLIDLQSRSLLNRNAEGRYKFSHKSILEYLVAKSYIENPESVEIKGFEDMEMLKYFFIEEIEEKMRISILGKFENIKDIRAFYINLSPFPQKKDLLKNIYNDLTKFYDFALDINNALQDYHYINQKRLLNKVKNDIEEFRKDLSFTGASVKKLFKKVAENWHEILAKHLEAMGEFSDLPNPFVTGNALEAKAETFVGRRDILTEIKSQILKEGRADAIFFVGNKRTGKTSTLKRLPLFLPSHISSYFFSGQDPRMLSEKSFVKSIAKTLEAKDPKQYQDLGSLTDFLETLEAKLQKEDKYMLLCFDEYENLTKFEALPNTLRFWMQSFQHIVFLLAGSNEIEDQAHLTKSWREPLRNARNIWISYLDKNSAYQLITQPIPEYDLEYENEALPYSLLERLGCQPYLLQYVMYELTDILNVKKSKLATQAEIEEAIGKMLSGSHHYFSDIWAELVPKMQEHLIELASEGTIQNPDVLSIKKLLRKEFIQEKEGTYIFYVPVLKEWILENFTL